MKTSEYSKLSSHDLSLRIKSAIRYIELGNTIAAMDDLKVALIIEQNLTSTCCDVLKSLWDIQPKSVREGLYYEIPKIIRCLEQVLSPEITFQDCEECKSFGRPHCIH